MLIPPAAVQLSFARKERLAFLSGYLPRTGWVKSVSRACSAEMRKLRRMPILVFPVPGFISQMIHNRLIGKLDVATP